jgi:hypothetical protein
MINKLFPKIYFTSVVLLLGCLNLLASDSTGSESDQIIPIWAIESLNLPQESFVEKNSDFSLIMSGRGNEALGIKKGYNSFWDTALIYIKDDKINAITLAFSKDFPKAKKNCLNALKELIVRYGSKFEIAEVRLDHVIAPDANGYGLGWTTNDYNVLLKFGPLNNEKSNNFQLQIIFSLNTDKSPFTLTKVPGAEDQIKMWQSIIEYFDLVASKTPELKYLKTINYTPSPAKEKGT